MLSGSNPQMSKDDSKGSEGSPNSRSTATTCTSSIDNPVSPSSGSQSSTSNKGNNEGGELATATKRTVSGNPYDAFHTPPEPSVYHSFNLSGHGAKAGGEKHVTAAEMMQRSHSMSSRRPSFPSGLSRCRSSPGIAGSGIESGKHPAHRSSSWRTGSSDNMGTASGGSSGMWPRGSSLHRASTSRSGSMDEGVSSSWRAEGLRRASSSMSYPINNDEGTDMDSNITMIGVAGTRMAPPPGLCFDDDDDTESSDRLDDEMDAANHDFMLRQKLSEYAHREGIAVSRSVSAQSSEPHLLSTALNSQRRAVHFAAAIMEEEFDVSQDFPVAADPLAHHRLMPLPPPPLFHYADVIPSGMMTPPPGIGMPPQ